MNIIFMGTPDFAIPSLSKILESKHKVLAVVTAPDKARGRGQKLSFTAVKQFAIDKGIPVLQPEKLKDENFIEELNSLSPDLFVVVAFRILPREVFKIPKYGSFNLHASLLPKYRGAAPIQWSLINGEKETGVTTFALADKVDTGNMYIQEKIDIDENDNLESLHDKLSVLGADVVLRTIDLIDSGNFKLKEQKHIEATPAPKITKETCAIDWNKTSEEVHNLIRGLSPYPGAFFTYENKVIKVFKSKPVDEPELNTGEILQTKNRLFAGCGKGSIEILELQLEGRKKLTAEEFLRGFSFVSR